MRTAKEMEGKHGWMAVLKKEEGDLFVHTDDCGIPFVFDTPEEAEADGKLEEKCCNGHATYLGTVHLPRYVSPQV